MDRSTQPRTARRNEKRLRTQIIPGGAVETLSEQDLIARIAASHKEVTGKADQVILAALDVLEKQEEVGQYLMEARRRHPREFVFWLETNLRHISVSTAYRYIRAANLSHLRKNLPAMQALRNVYLLTDGARIPGLAPGDAPPPSGMTDEPKHQLELFFGIQWPRLREKIIEPQLASATHEELVAWLEYARGPHEFYLEVERRLRATFDT